MNGGLAAEVSVPQDSEKVPGATVQYSPCAEAPGCPVNDEREVDVCRAGLDVYAAIGVSLFDRFQPKVFCCQVQIGLLQADQAARVIF